MNNSFETQATQEQEIDIEANQALIESESRPLRAKLLEKVTDRYTNSRVIAFAQEMLIPAEDVKAFLKTADESEGLTKMRHTVAAAIASLSWSLRIDNKMGSSIAVGMASKAILAPEYTAELIQAVPAIGRFFEAAKKLLAGQESLIATAEERWNAFLEHYSPSVPQA